MKYSHHHSIEHVSIMFRHIPATLYYNYAILTFNWTPLQQLLYMLSRYSEYLVNNEYKVTGVALLNDFLRLKTIWLLILN